MQKINKHRSIPADERLPLQINKYMVMAVKEKALASVQSEQAFELAIFGGCSSWLKRTELTPGQLS